MAEGATGDPVRMKYTTKELVNAVLKAKENSSAAGSSKL